MPGQNKTLYIIAGLGLFVAAAAAAVYMFAARPGTVEKGADVNDLAQVAAGKSVYDDHCASCHGVRLEGQANWRQSLPTGGFPAPPHDETGHTWHHPDQLLFDLTKRGGAAVAGAGFKSNMPGFGATLADAEIWAVLAYIKSRWPEKIRARQDEITRRVRQQQKN